MSYRYPVIVVAILAVAALGAQQPSFRASVELVEVDAVVVDNRGRPVKDLSAADFEVLEDGHPQAISNFALIDIPVSPSSERMHFEPDVASNAFATSDRRIWVLLLDSPSVPACNEFTGGATFTRLTQNVATRFVQQATGPEDLIAVIHVHGSMTASQPLARSKALALRSIDRLSVGPVSPDCQRSAEEQISMMMNTYRMITEVATRLGSITSRRTALLWIGGRVAFDPTAYGPKEFQHAAPMLLAAHRDAINAAQRNHVAIYPIEPSGLSTDLAGSGPMLRGVRLTAEPEIVRNAGLRNVAEETGGYAVVNTNDFARGFARIRDEHSTYYLLGYHPSIKEDGRGLREISVRVKRPGLTVRSRKGYSTAAAPGNGSSSKVSLAATAAEALRTPLPIGGIRLGVFATPFRGSSTTGTIVLGAHVRGEDLTLTGDAILQVAYQILDAEARTVVSRSTEYRLPPGADQRALIRREGIRFIEELSLSRGRFEIRYAVHDRGSAVGSVVTYVEVPNFGSGRLMMSGLLVASPGAVPELTVRDNRPISRSINATPVRRFPTSSALSIFGIVYTERANQPAVTLEASIADTAGKVWRDHSNGLVIQERSGGLGERHVTVHVPLEGLPPAAYVFKLGGRRSKGSQLAVERVVPFWVVDDQVESPK